jgi:hypothetical protein
MGLLPYVTWMGRQGMHTEVRLEDQNRDGRIT